MPEDIPEGYDFYIGDMGGEMMFRIDSEEQGKPPIALMTIHPPTPSLDGGKCGGAWVVSRADAKKGWGPLVYDVAIEWATQNGGGLTPDRDQVSSQAQSVWNQYLRRTDVQHHTLDSGDCKLPKSFLKSSLGYRYTKKPDRITALKRLGKLKRD